MEAIQILTEPLVIIAIAIGVFTFRVIYLARRLKSASRDPTFADLRALEDAKKALDKHKESLDEAKGALQANLGGARDTLRHYKAPYKASVDVRRKGIEKSMDDLDRFDEPLERAKAEQKGAFRGGFASAQRLYKEALPRKTHRAPKD